MVRVREEQGTSDTTLPYEVGVPLRLDARRKEVLRSHFVPIQQVIHNSMFVLVLVLVLGNLNFTQMEG